MPVFDVVIQLMKVREPGKDLLSFAQQFSTISVKSLATTSVAPVQQPHIPSMKIGQNWSCAILTEIIKYGVLVWQERTRPTMHCMLDHTNTVLLM